MSSSTASSNPDLFTVTTSAPGTSSRGGQRHQRQQLRAAAAEAAIATGDANAKGSQSQQQKGGKGLGGTHAFGIGHYGSNEDSNNNEDDDDFFSDPPHPRLSPSPPVLSLSPSPSTGSGGGGKTSAPATPAYDFRVVLSTGTTSQKPIVLSSGSGCVQGLRSTMEDEHFISLNEMTVRDQPVSLIGILDGHCGRRVATLGKKYLPHYFFKHSALGDNNALVMVESILQTDRVIFHELHNPHGGNRKGRGKGRRPSSRGGRQPKANDMFNTSWGGGQNSKRGKNKKGRGGGVGGKDDDDDDWSSDDDSQSPGNNNDDDDDDDFFSQLSSGGFGSGGVVGGGSTLIAAAVHGRMLYVACLGDARAVLLDGRTTIPLSEDHKPQNVKESKRINRCGGFVQFGRVCGVLAVSRALGDYEFKLSGDQLQGMSSPWDMGGGGSFGHPQPQQQRKRASSGLGGNKELMVSNIADVKQLSLSDNSHFLLLACDGLWDVLTNEEATQFVKDFLTYTPDINDPLAASGEKPKPSAAAVKRALDSCCRKLAEFAVDRGSTDNVSVTVVFLHDVVDSVVGFSGHHSSGNSQGGGALLRQYGAGSTASGRSRGSGLQSRGGVAGPGVLRFSPAVSGLGIGTLKKRKKRKNV